MPCPEKLSVGERIGIAHHLVREQSREYPYTPEDYEGGRTWSWSKDAMLEIAKKLEINKEFTEADFKAIDTMAEKIYRGEKLGEPKEKKIRVPSDIKVV